MTARALKNVMVTGGAGFIGSNFVRYLLDEADFDGRVINVDALTYAGNAANLAELDVGGRHIFEHADIRDPDHLNALFKAHEIDTVVHLAAESHVDRSIVQPDDFITTNVMGTFNLLQAAREAWGSREDVLFHHVSTDEVYGSLGKEGAFSETTPYDPRSPYSASKASSDHLVRAFGHTYDLPTTISNCSNNYGPYQFPEKLVPLMILNMLEGKALPIYGDGSNVRDWLYVADHASALWAVLRRSPSGETWSVGGNCERTNLDLVNALCQAVAIQADRDLDELRSSIEFVRDRPGHDQRYAVDASKIARELGWTPTHDLASGLKETVAWYLANDEWIAGVKSGTYRKWLIKNYGDRS